MRSAVSLMVAVYLELCVVSSQEKIALGRCGMGVSLVGGGRLDEAEILLRCSTSKIWRALARIRHMSTRTTYCQ
jgi:hypothetical protein